MRQAEARAREGLPPAKDGDEPRVQQQLVPLSYGMQVQPKGINDVLPPADDTTDDEDEPEDNDITDDTTDDEKSATAFILLKDAMKRAA